MSDSGFVSGLRIFNIVFYAFMIVLNVWYYLWCKVLKLEHKQFHLIMFTFLQLSFMFGIATQIGFIRGNFWSWSDIMFTLLAFFNIGAHSLFALQYWALSKKIEIIFT
jgi:hypothetical protein